MRLSRALATAMAATVGSAGLLVALPAVASADVVGQVTLSPTSGTNPTIFGGSATTACPAGTTSSFWSMEGGDLTPYAAYLGAGANGGIGAQTFSGASVSNIKTTTSEMSVLATYQVVFHCMAAGGIETDSYRSNFAYNPASGGTWTASAATLTAVNTSTVLTSDAPGSTVEVGTVVNFSATVTPASGATSPTGSVEFFDGATSLGLDNTLVSGVATFAWTSSGVSNHTTLHAVYTPAAPVDQNDRGFAASTAPDIAVNVTAYVPRATDATLAVDIVTGNAYQNVTLDCDVVAVTPADGTPAGNVSFKDGTSLIATVPLSSGSAQVVSNSFGAGAHAFTCEMVANGGWAADTSNTVNATYVAAGGSHEQNVIVNIPVGLITITTPFTTASPLDLGVAVLDQSDSTYSAFADLNGIVVTDTRAGNLGWTAKLIASPFTTGSAPYTNGVNSFPGLHAGLTGVTAVQVAGNNMDATIVVETDTLPFTVGLGSQRTFASYPAGDSTGSVRVDSVFRIDQVPTSIAPGIYTSLVTFTAI